ncbi:MAG: hypothetical protein Q9220_002408 [cf. Caloplaca sp. 1 TL-2023]
MSKFKRVTVTGGSSRQNVLAPLRVTQIVDSKPHLPAEILSLILDYVTAQDLIRFARVSRRTKEMVYDDSRWIQRLRLMKCWNETEARRRAEAIRRRRGGSQGLLHEGKAERAGIGVDGKVGGVSQGETKVGDRPASDISWGQVDLGTDGQRRPITEVQTELNDGFDALALSPNDSAGFSSPSRSQDSPASLRVFSHVRSIRGQARLEYGKIHGSLNLYYVDAFSCNSFTTAMVFRSYRDPNDQAQILANLLRFSYCDIAQGWQERHEQLQSLTEAFEAAVAREFEQALGTENDEDKLRKYANVLTTLNGGRKAVDLFILKSPLVARKADLGDPLDCLRGDSGGFSLQESQSFFSNFVTVFNEQIDQIDRIFPPIVKAAISFLERASKDVYSEYIAVLFDEAHRLGIESYLIAVSGTYQQSLYMARALRPSKDTGDDFYEAVDRIVASAFELHIDLYLNEEYSSFKRRSEMEVSQWEKQLSEQDASMQSLYMSNVNRQADKRDFLTSFKKVVMMPVNVLPTFPLSSPFGGKSATAKALVNGENLNQSAHPHAQASTQPSTPSLINGTNLATNRSPTPLPEPPTTELAAKAAIMSSRLEGIRSLFSIEIALNLVHAAKSSIERAAIFYRAQSQFGEDARKQCQLVFVLLLQILGTRHIKSGFDQAVNHLATYDPKEIQHHGHNEVKPLVTFLELVNVGDLIQQMLDVFYEQEMVATRLTDRNDFLDPAMKEKKRFEQMLDERVAAGLNKGIEVLMSEVEFVCATTQKADDFNPEASGPIIPEIMDIGPSQTAKVVVDIVSSHTKMLIGSTDKNMLDVFNQEVGLRIFTALCKHLKRQRISVTGSIKLISDMNHYFGYIQSLKNQNLLQYFIALRELAQIYLVDPSDAKELATIIADGDRFHGIFRAEEVYEFAERRADWYQIRTKVERAMYGIGCAIM